MSNTENYDSPGAIAIIGMSGRFPGAKNLDEFWRNLKNGVESISFFSRAELEAAGREPALLNNPDFVNAGSVLNEIELFDASFFGFNPREAEVIVIRAELPAVTDRGFHLSGVEGDDFLVLARLVADAEAMRRILKRLTSTVNDAVVAVRLGGLRRDTNPAQILLRHRREHAHRSRPFPLVR